MPLISCRNLDIGYNDRTIAKNINFDINKGDYLCIIGENGAGKSTLMKTILGLQKPQNGTVEFSNEIKKEEIGYIPQQSEIQRNFPASVFEVVISGCLNKLGNKAFYSKKYKEIANQALNKLGIYDLRNKCYGKLSGGQKQRALLARALCATDKLLILDEPVSGLDTNIANTLYSIIEKLNTDDGIAIVMVTHDKTAITKANRICYIGKEVFVGTTQEYLEHGPSNLFRNTEETK